MNWSWIAWESADITAAAEAALAAKKAALEAVKAVPASARTFANTIGALASAEDDVSDVTQAMQLLVNVHPRQAIRDAAHTALDHLQEASLELDHDRGLWDAVNGLAVDAAQLPPEDRKLYEDTMRDMRRMGFALAPDRFAELKLLRRDLQKLENEFEKAINDWEDHIELPRERLGGLPERYIEGLARTDDGRYVISLKYPDLFPFTDLADDDEARRELLTKSLRKGGTANLERLAQMIDLRRRIAGMLGYPTHAEFVQEPRMSKTAVAVRTFLEGLIAKLVPAAHAELREVADTKRRMLGADEPVRFHEIAYWSLKLKKERYAFDPEEVRDYFPLARVLDGMFGIYQELLGVRFRRAPEVPVWHPEAACYEVTTAGGERLGYFFLDLHPRPGKYGHAAAFPVRLARQDAPKSVVALVCNFPKPTASNPSLMPHGEVETLLHEFGHCMHALLSGGRWQRQNGFGVSLDFVEALSQIFEYWAWDARSLARLSGHWKTGAPLPRELLDKMLASRSYRQASFYLAQAVRALYDLRMHSLAPDVAIDPSHLGRMHRDMKREYEQIELPDDAIFAAGWTHMADYDAGYYGYLWSKVYAADMFTRFAKDPLDTAVGAEYRRTVLGPGSSRPELELVRAFLGREPSQAAFLAELGIS